MLTSPTAAQNKREHPKSRQGLPSAREAATSQPCAAPRLPERLRKYRRYVDHFDMTEDEKADLLETVWMVAESVADDAFGIHPVQQAADATADEKRQRRLAIARAVAENQMPEDERR